MIEEAQHSLMFQEFVSRSGLDAGGLSWVDRLASRWIVSLGSRFPHLFFLFVLGGEDPIDYVQRRELREDRNQHPLLERVMRIHVTEEARHPSFARHYLRRTVPASARYAAPSWLSGNHIAAAGRQWLRLDCGADNPVIRSYYERRHFQYCGDVQVTTAALAQPAVSGMPAFTSGLLSDGRTNQA